MNLVAAEQRERSVAFDQIKAKGSDVLKDPRVMRGLGCLTGELLAAWDSAFLPNVRNGVVSLPHSVRQSNAFALIPLLEQESGGELLIDVSMFEPTLQRRNSFEASGGTRAELHEKTAECLEKWGRRSPQLTRQHLAQTFSASFPAPDTFFTTRPIVYMSSWVAEISTGAVGRLGIHEATHVIQSERDTEEQLLLSESGPTQRQLYLADSELEAYQTGAVILEVAGYDPNRSDLVDFRVAGLVRIQDQRERFAREMAKLGVIPTATAIAAQA